MSYFKNLFLLLVLHKVESLSEESYNTSDNYGPFKMLLVNFKPCKGPKTRDLAKFDHTIRSIDEAITYNYTFYETGKLDEVKMSFFTLNGKTKKLLYTYRINKPCQHFVVAELVNNCLVKKGLHSLVVNYTEYTKKFFGKSFFYGDYEMKCIVLSNKGNIMCMNYNFQLLPDCPKRE